MIVAVNYQFHDYENDLIVIDTNKLNIDDDFEKDLKKALESKKKYIQLDGLKYEDPEWNIKAAVKKFPITIDAMKHIDVSFDC